MYEVYFGFIDKRSEASYLISVDEVTYRLPADRTTFKALSRGKGNKKNLPKLLVRTKKEAAYSDGVAQHDCSLKLYPNGTASSEIEIPVLSVPYSTIKKKSQYKKFDKFVNMREHNGAPITKELKDCVLAFIHQNQMLIGAYWYSDNAEVEEKIAKILESRIKTIYYPSSGLAASTASASELEGQRKELESWFKDPSIVKYHSDDDK